MTKKYPWLSFWILAVIWGSSYLFIRICVEELPPFQLVFIRTAIAALGLTVVVYLSGKRLPTNWEDLRAILFLGLINTVLPFALITWSEKHIESGLASVLQGTSALWSLVIAHFALADERITLRKVAGLVIGFGGIVVLASRSGASDIATSNSSWMHLLGQLAMLGSSLCYGLGNVFSRKAMQKRLEPIVVSAGAMIVASTITGVITYFLPHGVQTTPLAWSEMSPRVFYSILTLGFLNTFAAYLLYYPLIHVLGASRTSMITYIIPVVGLILGTIFLNEPVDLRLGIGAFLIVGSIAIVNLRWQNLRKPFSKNATASAAN